VCRNHNYLVVSSGCSQRPATRKAIAELIDSKPNLVGIIGESETSSMESASKTKISIFMKPAPEVVQQIRRRNLLEKELILDGTYEAQCETFPLLL
jgi:hypothetical protein